MNSVIVRHEEEQRRIAEAEARDREILESDEPTHKCRGCDCWIVESECPHCGDTK